MDKPTAGIRKRNQIKQANRTMFLWVAGMSVVVGVSIVLIVFLVQKIWFGEKVLSEMNNTVATLDKNIAAVDDLKDEVRVLNTNEALLSTRLDDSSSPLQSVLDALPANANSTALASSLQTKLLAGVPGIVLESINVVPVDGLETTVEGTSDATSGEIAFSFSVSADSNNYNALKQVLEKLEKSIRPINLKVLSLESQGNRVVLSASGVSYFDPAKTVQLKDKVVKP